MVLCVATLAVLLLFRDSEHISAAYGLALTITMITTTILLGIYLVTGGKKKYTVHEQDDQDYVEYGGDDHDAK